MTKTKMETRQLVAVPFTGIKLNVKYLNGNGKIPLFQWQKLKWRD